MNRTTFAAVAGVAALVLASCSSNSGTAASSASTSSSAASSAAVSAPAASAPQASAPAASAPASSAAQSGAPVSSAPVSSGAARSGAASSGAVSSGAATESAPAGSGSAPSSSAATGGAAGTLDGATTAWFDEFCGGLTPVFAAAKDVKAKQATVAKGDLAGEKGLIVPFLESSGTQVSDIATKLKALPAPTFTGGSEFATKTIAVFAQVGPALSESGKKLGAAAPTQAGLTSAASDLQTQLVAVGGAISAVGALSIPDATKNALLAVPACAKLQTTTSG